MLWNNARCSEEEHDLAWIQWYEALGTWNTDTRVHKDPEFPESLGHHFPRIYLPEPNLGAAYNVILVQNIIAPAPVCDDVLLVRVRWFHQPCVLVTRRTLYANRNHLVMTY